MALGYDAGTNEVRDEHSKLDALTEATPLYDRQQAIMDLEVFDLRDVFVELSANRINGYAETRRYHQHSSVWRRGARMSPLEMLITVVSKLLVLCVLRSEGAF